MAQRFRERGVPEEHREAEPQVAGVGVPSAGGVATAGLGAGGAGTGAGGTGGSPLGNVSPLQK